MPMIYHVQFAPIFLHLVFVGAFPCFSEAADSADALIVLTTVGYLTGAADGCGVAAEQSNSLSSGMSLAISTGNYGDPAQAQVLLNNSRQKGIEEAAAKRINCSRIEEKIRAIAPSLSN